MECPYCHHVVGIADGALLIHGNVVTGRCEGAGMSVTDAEQRMAAQVSDELAQLFQ